MKRSTIIFIPFYLFLSIHSVWGYSIYSGFTEGCHERITREALQTALPALTPNQLIPVPTSKTWNQIASLLIREDDLNNTLSELQKNQLKLVLVSLLIGVRSPDTEGHAVTNLSSLRQIHADPSAQGQYAHALRGPDDDGVQGDQKAVEGTRTAILDLINDIQTSMLLPPLQQIITIQLYVDFYGLVDIEVWEPAYLIGRSLHALQDSFAHTIRSDDLKRIRHVLNYVDAVAGDLNEAVDGLPHSAFMDQCDGDTAIIADAATLASTDLIKAINSAFILDTFTPITDILDQWVTYEPGCTQANDYCSSIWLDFARQEPARPYLEEIIGCSSYSEIPSHSHLQWIWSLLLLFSFIWLLKRSLLTSCHSFFCSFFCTFLGIFLVIGLGVGLSLKGGTHEAHAQISMQTEVHASVLSDAPSRSTLASTYGWGLRTAYKWGSWNALVHFEHNQWLSTELDDQTKKGVLNIGIGGAYIYGKGRLRSSLVLGISRLRFDTLFDQRGSTGPFIDLRPLEFRWFPLHWLSLTLTPFSFTYLSPVTEDPPIRMVLYRTLFGAEFIF